MRTFWEHFSSERSLIYLLCITFCPPPQLLIKVGCACFLSLRACLCGHRTLSDLISFPSQPSLCKAPAGFFISLPLLLLLCQQMNSMPPYHTLIRRAGLLLQPAQCIVVELAVVRSPWTGEDFCEWQGLGERMQGTYPLLTVLLSLSRSWRVSWTYYPTSILELQVPLIARCIDSLSPAKSFQFCQSLLLLW